MANYAPSIRVRIPQVTDSQKAIRLFYEKTEIGNAEINAIFGGRLSSARVAKLKHLAVQRMQENNIPRYDDHKVNIECAYEVWGIDIKRLERGIDKINKLFGGDFDD